MNRWSRLGLAVVAVWGIPALFLWFGVGSLLQIHREHVLRERIDLLDDGLTAFGDGVQETGFFATRLNRLWARIESRGFSEESVQGELERFRTEFPPGVADIFLFSQEGRLLSEVPGFDPQALEELFRYVTTPWREEGASSPGRLRALHADLPAQTLFDDELRQRPGAVIMLAKQSRELQPDLAWAWYQETSTGSGRSSKNDGIRGAFAILHCRRFPVSDLVHRVIEEQDRPDLQLGFVGSSGVSLAPRSLSGDEWSRIIDRFPREAAPQMAVRNLLVEGRSERDLGTLFAVCPIPRFPLSVLLAAFLAYLVGSFLLLRILYRHVLFDAALHLSLRGKIAFLFLLGFAFPTLTSLALGKLYLFDKQEEILESHRREATRRLDDLDSGFERFLGGIERELRDLCGNFGGIRSFNEIHGGLKSLQERLLSEDFWVLASDSGILATSSLPLSADLMRVLRLHGEFQEAALMRYLEGVVYLPEEEIRGILRGGKDGFPSRRNMQNRETERVLQGVRAIVREAMDQFDRDRGLPPAASPKVKDIAIQGALESGGGEFISMVRNGMGTLRLLQFYRNQGYAFASVVPGPDGRGGFFLLTSIAMVGLEGTYLDATIASSPSETGFFPIVAMPRPGGRGLVFPPGGGNEALQQVIDRMERQGQSIHSQGMVLGGVPLECTFRRGHLLQIYYLVHSAPLMVLEEKLDVYRKRVRNFLLGSILCGLLLAGLFIQRILRPLEEFDAGISALRGKRFHHRIPIGGNDELGALCREGNRTIAHLGDMEMASVIQNQLLPPGGVQVGRFWVEGRNIMTQAIGGDYFDFIPLPDGCLAIILGDVAGHGVSAALVTAMAKAGFTLLCSRHPDDPVTILSRLNTQFLPVLRKKKMMTVCMGFLDPSNGVCRIVNAGQCLPLHIRPGMKPEFVPSTSNPIGVLKKPRFATHSVNLEGNSLLFYSDGLIEAVNAEDTPLGFDGFVGNVRAEACSETPRLQGIFDRVRAFTDPVPWADDVTAVLIRDLGTATAPGNSPERA